MVSCLISSLQHSAVKRFVTLRNDRSFRKQEGSCLIFGRTMVEEIAKKRNIKTLLCLKPIPIEAENTMLFSPAALQKIIGYKTEDLVAAEVKIPPPAADITHLNLIALLDGLSDPGNVGTIFRTAAALGWDAIFVVQGSTDPYNDKAVRASRGAPLFIPWQEGSWDDVKQMLQKVKRQVVIADIRGQPLASMPFSSPLLLVLGHETKVPSQPALSLGEAVTIPMQRYMESLNVAAAASILLYTIREKAL